MWADNEADVDLLGFQYLVDGLVVALTEPRLLPLIVGVLGDWGSGKSSLARIAAQELRQLKTSTTAGAAPDPSSAYLVIEFSPWQHEDYDDVKVALMTAVLDAIQIQMPESADAVSRLRAFVNGLKRWGRRLGRAGAGLTPTAAPVVIEALAPGLSSSTAGLITSAAGTAAGAVQAALKDQSDAQVPDDATTHLEPGDIASFRQAFADLVSTLACEAVVVFIDDLDRCLPETIVDTFEAIRLFLNTPKTAYVLAMNQAVVESAIDSRYPELKKLDGAGIGRDYLEKMLQLKVSIPPLSAPEAETYANLLFAELYLSADEFARVLAVANANRQAAVLSVAFNVGIAGSTLAEVPTSLARDLSWAAQITPILGASLRGNPRQLKRFLNNLLLKHRSAARRQISLELPILAKLMVLEDQYNTDYQRLFDWEVTSDGACPELSSAEQRARRTAHDQSSQGEPRQGAEAELGTASESPPSDAEGWAAKPHIGEWLRTEPSLSGVDLRIYFTYSRDKLSIGVSASRMTPQLQRLLGGVQSDVEANRRGQYAEVAALNPSDRAQFAEALLERVRRYPAGVGLTAAMELVEAIPDMLEPVMSTLLRMPAAAIPPAAGTVAVRRLPQSDPQVNQLLDQWTSSNNTALAGVIQAARHAQARRRR